MPRANPIQNNFTAGLFSPRLNQRSDLTKYPQSCRTSVNGLTLPQGGWARRPGTRYVAHWNENPEDTYAFMRMEAQGVSYLIVLFNNGSYRVAKDGVLLDAANTPGTFTFTSDDDIGLVRYVQTGVLLYIVHPGRRTQVLRRTGDTFEIEGGDLGPRWAESVGSNASRPPLGELGFIDPANRVQLGYTGNLTQAINSYKQFSITVDGSTFRAYQIECVFPSGWTDEQKKEFLRDLTGRYVYFFDADGTDVRNIRLVTHTQLDLDSYEDGDTLKYMYCRTTGSGSLTASEGFPENNDDGHNNSLTGYLPLPSLRSTNAGYYWAASVEKDDIGFSDVVIFGLRLIFCGASSGGQNRIWCSAIDDFRRFSYPATPETDDDHPFTRTISGESGFNEIRWATNSAQSIALGTDNAEFRVQGDSRGLFTPSTFSVVKGTDRGSARVKPVPIDSALIFAQRGAQEIRKQEYDITVESFRAPTLSLLAEHVFRRGVYSMAYQQDPNTVIWCLMNDGSLVGVTYDDENGVIAVHEHLMDRGVISPDLTAGVKAIASAPDFEQGYERLWMLVSRQINDNGVLRQIVCLEYLQDEVFLDVSPRPYHYMDGMTVIEDQTLHDTRVAGLAALSGRPVSVYYQTENDSNGDQVFHYEELTVTTAGVLVLSNPPLNRNIYVGMMYNSVLETQNFIVPGNLGTSQSAQNRIAGVVVTALDTRLVLLNTESTLAWQDIQRDTALEPDGQVFVRQGEYYQINDPAGLRGPVDPNNSGILTEVWTPIITGRDIPPGVVTLDIPITKGSSYNSTIVLSQTRPLPMHVLSVSPRLVIEEPNS